MPNPNAFPRTTATNVVALIPAYNEEHHIHEVVLKAQQYADVVLVVDDGSCDATAAQAEAAGAVVIRHPQNQGKGQALNTGFQKAREFIPRVVVTLDADGQHLPEELPAIAAPIYHNQADIVVGSRYLEKRSAVPTHRIWGHLLFNLLTCLCSGVYVTDSQSGFRAFSAHALTAITFESRGFSVESEMQFLAYDHQLRVSEVPITIRYEDKPKRNVLLHGGLVLDGLLKLLRQQRPLLYFGLPGLGLFLLGFFWALGTAALYVQTQALILHYPLVSFLLTSSGLWFAGNGLVLHTARNLQLHPGLP